jgi:hypothetical protein
MPPITAGPAPVEEALRRGARRALLTPGDVDLPWRLIPAFGGLARRGRAARFDQHRLPLRPRCVSTVRACAPTRPALRMKAHGPTRAIRQALHSSTRPRAVVAEHARADSEPESDHGLPQIVELRTRNPQPRGLGAVRDGDGVAVSDSDTRPSRDAFRPKWVRPITPIATPRQPGFALEMGSPRWQPSSLYIDACPPGGRA